jgi:hypothetical protein
MFHTGLRGIHRRTCPGLNRRRRMDHRRRPSQYPCTRSAARDCSAPDEAFRRHGESWHPSVASQRRARTRRTAPRACRKSHRSREAHGGIGFPEG